MGVGVCAIFKDEAPYLREWVAFHRLQGVERFYLYDNDSTDGWREEIPELVSEVIPWPGKVRQMAAYRDALTARDVEWMAFIDIDEFLFDENGLWLPDLLAPVTADKVQVQWRMFGDGGHVERPDGLTIDCYLRCEEGLSNHGKQIVRLGKATRAIDPHHFDGASKFHVVPTLRLNHYWTRSQAECRTKFARGRADLDVYRQWEEFTRSRHLLNASTDTLASRLWGHAVRGALDAT